MDNQITKPYTDKTLAITRPATDVNTTARLVIASVLSV